MAQPVIREFKAGEETYVYNYELLSVEQCITAETFFRLHEKMFRTLPAAPSDIQLAADNLSVKHGYAGLLTKKNPDGSFEEYNPTINNNLDALRRIKGAKARRELEECRDDFFMKSGLVMTSSIESLTDTMTVIEKMPSREQELIWATISKAIAGRLPNSSSEMSSITPEPQQDGEDT